MKHKNDKRWVTERTEIKRKKKVEKKKEDRWTHKRTDRKERKKNQKISKNEIQLYISPFIEE